MNTSYLETMITDTCYFAGGRDGTGRDGTGRDGTGRDGTQESGYRAQNTRHGARDMVQFNEIT